MVSPIASRWWSSNICGSVVFHAKLFEECLGYFLGMMSALICIQSITVASLLKQDQ
jgi:hypothetical protein